MDRTNKIITIFIISITVLAIAMLNIQAIKTINNVTEKEYETAIIRNHTVKIKNKTIETIFTPVTKKIKRIEFDIKHKSSGSITYTVVEENGNVVAKNIIYLKKDAPVDKVELDVSDVDFDAGAKYKLITEFDFNKKVKITTNRRALFITQVYNSVNNGIYYCFLLIANLFLIALIIAIIKFNDKNIILFIASVVIGMMLVFLTAPFSREDEFRHFIRAYDHTYGGDLGYKEVLNKEAIGLVMPDKDGKAALIDVPKEIAELRLSAHRDNYNDISYASEINIDLCLEKLLSIFNQPESKEMITVGETATVGRGIEGYYPQVGMMLVARLFKLRSGYWYYMACLGQVVVSSLFLFFAAKLAGRYNFVIWITGLIPAFTLLRASANPDGLMIAEILFGLGIILYLRDKEVKLNSLSGITSILGFVVILYIVYKMKPPYVIMLLGCLLLLKKENFRAINWSVFKRKYIWIPALLTIMLVIAYVVVIRKCDFIFNTLFLFLPKPHIEYIFSHPVEIIKLFLVTGFKLLKDSQIEMAHSRIISYSFLFMFITIFFERREKLWLKGYLVLLFIVMLGVIVLVGYTLTPPDYGQIWGITYRYMLPVWPIIVLALPFGVNQTEEFARRVYPALLVIVIFANALVSCGMC